MYHDDPRIQVVSLPSDYEATVLLESYRKIGIDAKFITWNSDILRETGKQFDEWFYMQCGLPFDFRWSKFKAPRYRDVEDKLKAILNPRDKYIFVHDDPSRGFEITRDKIQSDLPIIKPVPGLTDNILGYYELISNAEEVHCIPSSFFTWIDSFIKDKPCYLHQYLRMDGSLCTTRNFKVLT
jgi:hypothetical protein